MPRLQALNTFVTVDAQTTPLQQLNDEYFKQFTAILISDSSEVQLSYNDDIKVLMFSLLWKDEAIRVNEIARKHGIAFFWAGCYADEGWFISDFGEVNVD